MNDRRIGVGAAINKFTVYMNIWMMFEFGSIDISLDFFFNFYVIFYWIVFRFNQLKVRKKNENRLRTDVRTKWKLCVKQHSIQWTFIDRAMNLRIWTHHKLKKGRTFGYTNRNDLFFAIKTKLSSLKCQ